MGRRSEAIISFQTKFVSDLITRPANTNTYGVGDAISEVTTNDFFTFGQAAQEDVGRKGFWSGTIEYASCTLNTIESLAPDLELWLFHTTFTETADNAAWVPTDAELQTRIAIIDFPVLDWRQGKAGAGGTGNSVNEQPDLSILYRLAGAKSANQLFGQLVVRNAYIPISGETFEVRLGLTLD